MSDEVELSVDELRAEVRRFFSEHAIDTIGRPSAVTADEVYTVLPRVDDHEPADLAKARAWQRALFDAGLAWVDGPPEYGGRGLTAEHAATVTDLVVEQGIGLPGPLNVGLDIVRPAVAHAGTDEQKKRWLPAIVRGDLVCCQLFSEPEAGSDLAGLRTTAVSDGAGRWTVNGQKVWSSGAQYSDLGLLLARTGPQGERHRAITLFLIDMRAPGVQVRPLRQMTGGAHFNEVFLDGVEVADTDRIGDVDAGWAVTTVTLNNERSAAGRTALSSVDRPTERLVDLARRDGRLDEAPVRTALAESYLREQLLRRLVTRYEERPDDTAGASIVKLVVGENLRRHVDAAQTLLGRDLVVDGGTPGTYTWAHLLLSAPAHRIAGGADEIQKNILAERVLGLPREPRPQRREPA